MFSLRLALQSIMKGKWINILSMISLSIGLFILFLVFLAVYHVEKLTARLPEKFSVMIYLKDSATEDDVLKIMSVLKNEPVVESIKFISKDQALKDLKNTLKDADYIIEGLDENPLSPSFDIRLKHEDFTIEAVRTFLKRVEGLKEVDDLVYGESFLESIYSIKNGMQLFGLTIGIIFSLSIVFICYSTVKILFYRHNEDIEIYKLLGATKNFIRAPFLIEGSIIGLTGGILSTFILFLTHSFLIDNLSRTIPLLPSFIVPLKIMLIIPFLGGLLGFTGAAIALGRLRY